ncbi:HAD-IA family hydrolase [Frigidibacter sp. RF13]|uniref:HAD family hydrolase n=1 Tax=Frigidibacter sp. RF13 TaxID=2997340 RepID=UPI00226F5B85|nr:HAD-IA family hydrolase [Frigidibacter sp. RF13]MCY1128368.1 HAD-IA family hydrolase [Frigidibacter sp. RF13]
MAGPAFDLVVWDFDGVLNRNIRRGSFVWQNRLRDDLGLDPRAFNSFVFGSERIRSVVQGKLDLREVVADWLHEQGAAIDTDMFLDYWFEKDALPDTETGALLDLCRGRKVIGTNNETRRAAYIEGKMGFSARVERIFASGWMGVAKPDDGFFATIEDWAGVEPGRILLIDDSSANVAAAHRLGWQAFHFTDETRHRLPGTLGIG